MPTHAFHTLDVFTDRALTGNPLAIVHGADGLDTAAMQRIAGEFNLSETVFILKPTNPAHVARIRIFTPARELPFAGHPTIGTAIHLAEQRHGKSEARDAILVLEEEIGAVRCGVKIVPGEVTYAEFDVPRLPQEYGKAASREQMASALGLVPSDIGFDHHKPSLYSAGVDYAFVPVRDRDALHRAASNGATWRDVFGAAGCYIYTRLPAETGHAFRARMFGRGLGIVEDPATGSAAAAFAGVITRFEGLADGRHVLPIEQGVEMGRASLITLEVELLAGRLTGARIGGKAVAVTSGTLSL